MVINREGQAVPQQDILAHRRDFIVSVAQKHLEEIDSQRKSLAKLIAITEARQELLDLALARLQDLESMTILECGWDSRWLWDECKIQSGFADGSIRQSYPDGSLNGRPPDHAVKPIPSSASSLWCLEGNECSRHSGWAKLLQEDLELERSDQVSLRILCLSLAEFMGVFSSRMQLRKP